MNKVGLRAGRPSKNKKATGLKDLSNTKETMIRVNFELEETEHLKLKIYSAKHRHSIADILRELIKKHIPNQT